ncbi:MAG: molybdopterin cofactor-binding domain-containing protein, partial [Bacteroidota bacterium]
AKSMSGVLQVMQIEEAVAVLADGFWQAKQALAQVDITYTQPEEASIQQADIFTQFGQAMEAAIADGEQEEDVKQGKVEKGFSSAAKVVDAEYQVPYLAHACMEPLNCTVWLHDGICEIWTGTQNPLGVKDEIAEFLGYDTDQVLVHNQYLGGGFGRRAETDVARQAVAIAQQVDHPVQLIWTREEAMRQDVYREANVSRFRAALDEAGKPFAWENQYVDKHHPPDAPHIPYGIANQFIHYVKSPTHIPWGNWRSVDHSLHGFFTESFIDELAVEAQQDPYEYRRELLKDQPRFLKVLDMAAEKGNWGKPLPENWGRGIAIHKSFFTIVAEVVEVEIVGDKPKVHKVTCVADPGYAYHPDGFKAQMESGIMYGLSAALHGEITIENGAVKQSNFHDYEILRMDEAPQVETFIINSGHKAGGAGEPSTPAIAPAVANAIFDANGQRVRSLPIKLEANPLKTEFGVGG